MMRLLFYNDLKIMRNQNFQNYKKSNFKDDKIDEI